jgi:hypothetical protein
MGGELGKANQAEGLWLPSWLKEAGSQGGQQARAAEYPWGSLAEASLSGQDNSFDSTRHVVDTSTNM